MMLEGASLDIKMQDTQPPPDLLLTFNRLFGLLGRPYRVGYKTKVHQRSRIAIAFLNLCSRCRVLDDCNFKALLE